MDARPVTALLLLALCLWWSWSGYFKHVRAARKWENEQREAKARLYEEQRVAREAAFRKARADRYKLAAKQTEIIHRAEQLKRQRTGENLIYDDMRDKQDEALRALTKRRLTTDNITDLRGGPYE